MAGVTRYPWRGLLRVMPWGASIWRSAGGEGNQFVPGFVGRHVGFWHDITLKEHPLQDTLVLYVRNVVDIHDRLLTEYRGPSSACPFDIARFPGAVFHKRSPPRFTRFLWTTRYEHSWSFGCEVGGRPSPREGAAA